MTTPTLNYKRPRLWRCLHASTYVVLALTATVLFFLNVPGQYAPHVGIPVVDDWTTDDPRIVRERLEHGWPLAYLIRDDNFVLLPVGGPAPARTAVWSFSENFVSFHIWPLLANIIVALCLLGAIALGAEYWRRQRRSIWQLRLIDLLGLTALVAIATWFALATSRDYQRELSAMQNVARVSDSNWSMGPLSTRGGPTWLRSFVGDEHFPRVFDRLAYACVVDWSLPELVPFKKLKGMTIYLDQPNYSDTGLPHLQSLEAIEVSYHFGVSTPPSSRHAAELDAIDQRLASFLTSLEMLPKLWLICATGDGVGDRSAKAFATLPRLRALKFSSCRLSDEGLRSLADCPLLEDLHFENVDVTANGLQHLQKLQNLHTLSLSGCWLYGPVFEQLAKLSTLRRLDLRGAYVNSAKLLLLADLPALQTLSLPPGFADGTATELKRRLARVRIDLDGKEILASDDPSE